MLRLPTLTFLLWFALFNGSKADFLLSPVDSTTSAYREEWRQIRAAMDNGLPKTALVPINKLFAKALRDKNHAHIAMAAMLRAKLESQGSPAPDSALIGLLERERKTVPTIPGKAMITSLTAKAYEDYLNRHRWQLRRRTSGGTVSADDITTWNANNFTEKIRSLYLLSLEPRAALQAIPLRDIRDALQFPERDTIGRDTSSALRPTLYDILAHRAIAYFTSQTEDNNSPVADSLLIRMFSPTEEFVRRFYDTDQPNGALRVFAELLRFHAADAAPDALLDAELARLNYIRTLASGKRTDTLYKIALERTITKYQRFPAIGEFFHALAEWYNSHDNAIQALQLCNTVITTYPHSRGDVLCRNLKGQILTRQLGVTVEPNIRPNKPALLSIQYNQLTRLYFRLVRSDAASLLRPQVGDSRDERLIAEAIAAKPLREWEENLPASPNLRTYTAQTSLQAMPVGRYILLAATEPNFQTGDSGAVSAVSFIVSSLSVIRQEISGQPKLSGWYLTDLETGHPRSGVSVTLFARRYDYSARQEYIEKRGEAISDSNGFIPQSAGEFENYSNVILCAHSNADTLVASTNVQTWQQQPIEPSLVSHIYTDRTLYRPGQTVYFKGIIVRSDIEKKSFTAAKDVEVSVELRDPNGTRITDIKLRTNEFGSYNGMFTLPRAGMKGSWNISDGKGSAPLRVEEYKRPKFSATFQQPEGAVTLGSNITVRGTATTFAGSAVSGATVRYRVVRNVRFHPWKWGFYPEPIAEETITTGTTTSDKLGEFAVQFPATPDASADAANSPVFVFSVTADITDAAGETHTAALDVSAGYASVEIGLEVAEFVPANSPLAIPVSAKNLNGRPAVVNGSVTIQNLAVSPKIRRERGLPEPNVLLVPREDFTRDFPEDSPATATAPDIPLPQTSLVNITFTTTGGYDTVHLASLRPGIYRLTAIGTDPEGKSVNLERIINVYGVSTAAQTSAPPKPEPFIAFTEQTTAQPGENVRFIIGSGYADARALYILEKDGVILRREWLTMANELRAIDVPVTEELRGGFSASVILTHSGRTYQSRFTVRVPWSNKELRIATSVFRDKVRPGAKEEWRLTVKGSRAEKVTAELLAAMYDASLDAILGSWEKTSWAGRMFPWPEAWQRLQFQSIDDYRQFSQQTGESWHWWSFYSPFSEYPQLWTEVSWLANLGFGKSTKIRREYIQDVKAVAPGIAGSSEFEIRGGRTTATQIRVDGLDVHQQFLNKAADTVIYKSTASDLVTESREKPVTPPRTNLNEMAFFFPQLRSNEAGEYVFSFTMPEALTTWRFMALAHTADLQVGTFEREVITQKELMVLPNAPRFLREGDTLTLPITIANLTDRSQSGTARLALFDAETMKPVNELFGVTTEELPFSLDSRGNAVVSWRVIVPTGIDAVTWRVTASAGDFSDGEESMLPVLPNSTLVTETLPVTIRGSGSRSFTLKNLAALAKKPSPTLKNRKLTFEFAENPVWYAVQALPLLMEYPHECAEQLFNRFAANAIAGRIVKAQSKIGAAIRRWAEGGSLVSPLEKNESLKSVMLNETPWAAEGKSETERKQRIARLLDENSMNAERQNALRKLRELQQPSGGFSWFAGMQENPAITHYILCGIAHILALNAAKDEYTDLIEIARSGIRYADSRAAENYYQLKTGKGFNPDKLSYYNFSTAQYLYARSFFYNFPTEKRTDSALEFYQKQAAQFWQKQDLQTQAMTAIALWQEAQYEISPRNLQEDSPNRAAAKRIIASLRERAVRSEELGMYWVQPAGWEWQNAPIETQALLIEAFELVGGAESDVEDMRYWLIRSKQTHDWRTTKATAEACYALLLRGKNMLENSGNVTASVGGKAVEPESREAGTGYYSVSWTGAEITPAMANVTLNRTGEGVSYGGLYWQYMERTDNIREQKSAISVERSMIIQQPKEGWEILARFGGRAYVGARISIRITIRTDREMEYVHVKDSRASGFEPAVQTSGYEWGGGIGYYRSPSDASVSFFIERLPRGTTVIEYDLIAAHEGAFSNGIATVQSLYAPEFGAHTAGGRMTVEK